MAVHLRAANACLAAGGTTALWDYLQQHPQIRPAIAFPDEPPHYTKELHYFSNARKEYTKARVTVAWPRQTAHRALRGTSPAWHSPTPRICMYDACTA